MTDPKKMAGMAMELLPPPDRMKKKPPMGGPDDPVEEDAEDSSTKAGERAMQDFESATDPGAKWDAFCRAMDAYNSNSGAE
jgi:hypothetical protein